MPSLATIILAAGKGERMRSELPKVLQPIAGDPMLCYPIETAEAVAARPIICVLGHGMEQAKKVLGRSVKIVHQKQQQGTADAVGVARKALSKFSGDVLILYGDVPFIGEGTLKALLRHHRDGKYAMSLLTACFENPAGYGRIIRNGNGNITRIIEESDLNREQREIREINTGIYLLDKDRLFDGLTQVSANAKKAEYYLTDLVEIIADRGGKVGGLSVADPVEVMGVNSPSHLAWANRVARERINRAWMERGVRLVDPGSTYIDRSVTLESDVVIGKDIWLYKKHVQRS